MRKLLTAFFLFLSLASVAQDLQVLVKGVDIGASHVAGVPYQAPYGTGVLSGTTANLGNESVAVTVNVSKADNSALTYFYMDSYVLDTLTLGAKYLHEEPSRSFAPVNGKDFVVSRGTPINLSADAARSPFYLLVVVYAAYTYNGTEHASITISKTRIHPGPATPLPVKLTAFDAVAVDSRVHVTWHTATELNASRYELEKSDDGNSWELVAKVRAKGAGDYSVYDVQDEGFVYYRLKEVDDDGTSQYSAVRTVSFGAVDPVLSVFYYDAVGRRIPRPSDGFFIEVRTYTSGRVERKKVYQQ